MATQRTRTYSRAAREAVTLLGRLIRLARTERRMTAQDLAERAGISRTTLQKIERGEMTSEIGLVFEVAVLAGVPLFETRSPTLTASAAQIEGKLALLPQAVRSRKEELDDDF